MRVDPMQWWYPDSTFPRFNVHEALLGCSEDPFECTDHCHWRVIDHKEGETVAYVYTKDNAQKVADTFNSPNAVDDLVEAIRLTVEYVGTDVLYPGEGWSWYEALKKYRSDLAQHFVECHEKHVVPNGE